MMASFSTFHFNRRWYDSDYESELIAILKKEYDCDRAYTLICLGHNDELYGFPDIVLRSNGRLGLTKCLADMKDRILDLIRKDESIINVRDCLGLSPLHLICSLHSPGQMEILKLLCTQRTSYANTLDSMSRTPLHHAVSPANMKYHSECNDSGVSLVDIVTLLIKHGADVNAMECHGLTPLHLALDYYRSGSSNRLRELPELIRTLIESGASLNLKAPCGSSPSSLTPLHLACRLHGRPSLDVLSLMISPDYVNSTDHRMKSPLHELLSIGDKKAQHSDHSLSSPCNFIVDKARLLLDCGADVNARDYEGVTPLLMVLDNPNNKFCVPLVKLLLEKGAIPNVRLAQNRASPLHLVCKHFDDDVVEQLVPLFLKAGARINARDYKLLTPFHCALFPRNETSCKIGTFLSVNTLRTLIKFGADPTLNDVHENSSIHMVCMSPNHHIKDVISFLISEGCKINNVNKQGNTPLLHFLQNNFDKKSIQTLIDLGANCQSQNLEDISPLHLVSRSLVYHDDVDEIIEAILKGGANVNVQDCYGNTPIHYAVRDESTTNMKGIRKLLLAGANLNITNSLGMAPLHIVCSNGGHFLAKTLLDFGADVNLKDGESNTPLHIAQAANENASSICRVLVENGADLAAKNCRNATPFVIMNLNTYHFMIGHTVLLIVSGKYNLNKKESALLDYNGIFRKRYLACFSCAPAMKTQFIANSSITLLDFLLARNERALRYIHNPEIFKGVNELADSVKYRWYSSMIKDKMNELLFLKTLFDRTSKSLRIIWSPFHYPDILIEKVISHLDEADMNALNRAVFFASCSSNII
uniref:Putative ankyrin repeat protein FPV162 n=1 Tax=Lygus hesperus TaxID=30085 RepID=A0A146LN40_LYGHE